MPKVRLFTRIGCHLCDEVKLQLDALRARSAFELVEVDIDQDAALREKYNEQVPVVAIGDAVVCRYRLNVREFLRKLKATQQQEAR
jgi:glutaredoxin